MQKDGPYVSFQSVDFYINSDISVGEDGLHLRECVIHCTREPVKTEKVKILIKNYFHHGNIAIPYATNPKLSQPVRRVRYWKDTTGKTAATLSLFSITDL